LVVGSKTDILEASWLITFLGCHPTWKANAILEIQKLLSSHPLPTSSSDSKPSLSTHLSTIPISAWESQTPILDGFIRETLRLAQPHIAMRRNIGPDVYIGDRVVPTGAYILYPFSDVHLDPKIYDDPWRFDPGREERNDKVEGSFEYVGWGAGKSEHPNSSL
jgi:sterol 14-demethylase